MNIFFLSRDPNKAAEYAYDVHVRKMLIETAQILGTACRLHPNPSKTMPFLFYEVAYPHHPSVKWAQMSIDHYNWLCRYHWALCSEYTHRFGKRRIGAFILNELHSSYCPDLPELGWVCDPTPALGDYAHLNIPGDVVGTYRAYYRVAKNHLHKYSNRTPPEWL